MSDREFERALNDWLESGSDRTPPQAIDAVLLAARTTPQERELRLPWRTPQISLQLRLAAVVAIVAIAGLASMMIFRPGPGPGSSPGPSSPAPSSTLPLVDTSGWIAYTSERYGFDIKRPPDWNETASDHDWTFADGAPSESTAPEHFEYPVNNQRLVASAWSVAVEPGTTAEAWFDAYCPLSTYPCNGLNAGASILMAGHPGSIVAFRNDVQAFFLVDARMYVVAEWRPDDDPTVARYGGGKRLIEAFISTMTLRKDGPAPVASPPALTETFTSTLYGYSIDFPSAFWTATAGTVAWVGGLDLGADGLADTFLPPSTNNGFRAAAAVIPAGTNVDQWITDNAIGVGTECAPVRSTLSDILIDGQTGKVRISCEELEATVVVNDRVYLFTLFLDTVPPYTTAGGRALFDAMIATVQLTPETVVATSPTPS